jgi:acyl-CoA synthetase
LGKPYAKYIKFLRHRGCSISGVEDFSSESKSDFPSVKNVHPSTDPDFEADKIIYLAFTSGTTDDPKGVMHSDNTLLANARALVEDWRQGEHTILFTVSPLSHHIGTVAIAQTMVAGGELVLHDQLSKISIYEQVVRSGANYVMGVPTHAIDILAEMEQRRLNHLGNVKIFYMAGSPIPREVGKKLLGLGIKPQNIYGMTENSSHQYPRPTDDDHTLIATCGRACKGYEVAIWKESNPDELAAPGEIGEIGGRGALLMLGYFDNQIQTENSFNTCGWFMSGDLGRFDEKGNLEIMGRKKDLIIRGGHNIHPIRIEEVAISHPDIEKVAAFPVPDERLGEKACLAIIPKKGKTPEPMEVLDFLYKNGLSKYDMPEYFCNMEAFPLTASGKILKRSLVENVKNGSLKPTPMKWVDPEKRAKYQKSQ